MWVSEAMVGETPMMPGSRGQLTPPGQADPPSESIPLATCICLALHWFSVWRIWQGDTWGDPLEG